MKTVKPFSPAPAKNALSLHDRQKYARLSCAVDVLLQYWHAEGVVDAEVDAMLVQIDRAWRALPHPCRCDPPGSGNTLCTGHCAKRGV